MVVLICPDFIAPSSLAIQVAFESDRQQPYDFLNRDE